MVSKIEPVVLNGHNYAIWETYMETLLKRKGLWFFTKNYIVHLIDVDAKISISVKKDEVLGVIMNYISREICFHTSGIDCPHAVWTMLKTLFNKINEG